MAYVASHRRQSTSDPGTSPRRSTARPARNAMPRIDFGEVNRAALGGLRDILARWLPDGRVNGREFVALNPRRHDRRPG